MDLSALVPDQNTESFDMQFKDLTGVDKPEYRVQYDNPVAALGGFVGLPVVHK